MSFDICIIMKYTFFELYISEHIYVSLGQYYLMGIRESAIYTNKYTAMP